MRNLNHGKRLRSYRTINSIGRLRSAPCKPIIFPHPGGSGRQVTYNPLFKAIVTEVQRCSCLATARALRRLIETGASMKTLAICFLVLYAATTARLSAQATDCNDPHASPEANASSQQQWENGSSPVYADATELARTLDERGFQVQCIRRSVEERLFKGEKGAASARLTEEFFEVWFLPTPGTLLVWR